MLLTLHQEYLLSLLQNLGGARIDQLAELMYRTSALDSNTVYSITRAAIRQMEFGNTGVHLNGEIVTFGGTSPKVSFYTAVDAMLALSQGKILSCAAQQPPLLLRFTIQEPKPAAFAVMESQTMQMPALSPGEIVVVLQNDDRKPTRLPIPNQQIIAIRQEDGHFRFFALKASAK